MKPFLIASLICLSIFFAPASALATEWKSLHSGLDYTRLTGDRAILHAFRISLLHFTLSPIVQNPPFPVKYAVLHEKAVLGINANFFDSDKHPLGLVVKDSQRVNPLRKVNWWGVFAIEKARAMIAASAQFHWRPSIETAIQSGPRLLADGNIIPGLKDSVTEKSVVCIADPEHVILIASEGSLAVSQLVQVLKDELHCTSALNLDGGSSTQLYAKVGRFELDLPATSAVPVILAVFAK